ncbi:hypothetical protein [Leptospira idonii]|uniref:Uncharacterized protein n=1 Tax=Leptospira idonii TaxID=1193500 RepID=A0A4V3JYP6_9LEPT|nr:hypothetical protein [Leptospira idonii]TGN20916.1 hypothetical protein EHS15_01635 [Leptospira idonii]
MFERRISISQALAQELVKTIRLLALSGKSHFRKYLYDPLAYAGWEKDKAQSSLSAGKMMDKLKEDIEDPAYQNTIGPQCKRLVSNALSETLSALGDSCIFFLERIQEDQKLAQTPEALDFVSAIEKSLKDFSVLTQTKNEKLFEDTIRNFTGDELRSAFEPVKLDTAHQKVYLEKEVHNLYQQILAASKTNNFSRCKKLLSKYIIDYSDSDSYNESEVEKLLSAVDKREPGFKQNVMDSLAIDLYYSVTKGILEGNARKAIQGIRKYAHIFEGNPDIKNYYEIDSLERKLYGIIQAKDLMKDLKKGL